MKQLKKRKKIIRLPADSGIKSIKAIDIPDDFTIVTDTPMHVTTLDLKQLKNKISLEIKKTLENSELWITRKELAKMAGVSETTLYQALKGKASLDSLMKVAKVLNIKIDLK